MPRNHLSRYKTFIGKYLDGSLETVRYHDTYIVKVDVLGNVTLNTGGWLSVTTKRKINAAIEEFNLFNCHVSVFQQHGKWFINVSINENSYGTAIEWDGTPITLDRQGNIVSYNNLEMVG